MFSKSRRFIRGMLRITSTPTYLHAGVPFREFLRAIHDNLKPSTYLGIGVAKGKTFRLATCLAIGVDPAFKSDSNLAGKRSATLLFQMTANDFFASHNLRQFVPNCVDFAFLDGMHLFEFLLCDFINTERNAHEKTIVTMHDCLPLDVALTSRTPRHGSWAGDVWKLLPILRKHRPELHVTLLDCPPTGLVVVTGLDPDLTVLSRAYEAIVAEFHDITFDAYGINRFRQEFPARNSRAYMETETMRQLLHPQ